MLKPFKVNALNVRIGDRFTREGSYITKIDYNPDSNYVEFTSQSGLTTKKSDHQTVVIFREPEIHGFTSRDIVNEIIVNHGGYIEDYLTYLIESREELFREWADYMLGQIEGTHKDAPRSFDV